MVSALSVGNPFDQNEAQRQKHIMTFVSEASDILTLITTVGAYEYAGGSDSFCRDHGLRQKVCSKIKTSARKFNNIRR